MNWHYRHNVGISELRLGNLGNLNRHHVSNVSNGHYVSNVIDLMVSSLLRMVHDRVGRHGGQDWRGSATESRRGGGVDSYGWKGAFDYLKYCSPRSILLLGHPESFDVIPIYTHR